MINGTIHMTTCERDAVLSAQKKVELIHEHKNKARLTNTKAKVRLLITVCILDGWTDFHSSIGYTCPKHQPKKNKSSRMRRSLIGHVLQWYCYHINNFNSQAMYIFSLIV